MSSRILERAARFGVTRDGSSLRAARLPVLLLAMALLAACDHGKMDVPAAGPDEIAKPAPAGGAPMGASGPMGGASGPMGGGGMGGTSGPMAGAGAMSGSASASAAPAAGGADAVTGLITIAPGLAGKVPPGAVIFVIARPAGMDKGPPLATVRLTPSSFPVAFRLGPENVMMQGMPFQGEISLSARLDTDGNAMSRGPGDIAGAMPQPIAVGTNDIKLELNQPL